MLKLIGIGFTSLLSLATINVVAANGMWLSTSGGLWGDATNWVDGVVPNSVGGGGGQGDVADFSALDSGETVDIGSGAAAGLIKFAGMAGDQWRLTGESLLLKNSPNHTKTPDGDFVVDGGTLDLDLTFAADNDWTLGLINKYGSGDIRFMKRHTFSGLTWLWEGRVRFANNARLVLSPVMFAGENVAIALESDAQVGGLESGAFTGSSVGLGGKRLTLGNDSCAHLYDGVVQSGSLVIGRGDTQILTGEQGFEHLRVENGHLILGNKVNITGWWRFDDSDNPGRDSSGNNNHLNKSGVQASWVVNDSERGSVLSLGGSGAYLTQAASMVSNLAVGDQPYTVAFWFKPDSDINNVAGVYAWGPGEHHKCNMLRVDNASGPKMLYSNYGNNVGIAPVDNIMDGNWHHVAIVYMGSYFNFYVNGVLEMQQKQVEPLRVSAEGVAFNIGKAVSNVTFKGLIDDFFVAQGILSYAEIVALCSRGEMPVTQTPANLLPAGSVVDVAYNGVFELINDQEIGLLRGSGMAGGVILRNSATLSISEGGELNSRLAGSGKLIKCGGGGRLTLGGRVEPEVEVEISGGTVALAERMPVGLQAWYRFDDADDLGKDSSGNGYHLTAYGEPSAVDGVFGGGARMTEANQSCFKADVYPATFPVGNESYTVMAWCKREVDDSSMGALFCIGEGSNSDRGQRGNIILRYNSLNQLIFSNMGVDSWVGVNYSLSDGSWHHFAFSYDGESRKRYFYVDGIEQGSQVLEADLNIEGNIAWFGGASYSSANYLNGVLDDIMVFNRAVSAQEINDVMSGVFAQPWGSRLTDSVAARYEFEDSGNPGFDSGPYGYHLTRRGTVSVKDSFTRGRVLSFDGSNKGYLEFGEGFPENLPTGDEAVTISMWVNPHTRANTEGSMVFWGEAESKKCHLMRLARSAGGNLVFRYVDGSWFYLAYEEPYTFDYGIDHRGWHHLAVSYGPGGLRSMYLDGERVASERVSDLSVSGVNFHIGYKPNAPSYWFQGELDDVTIYNCALSRAEIQEVIRGRRSVLSEDRVVSVAEGALFDVGTAEQQLAGMSGSGGVNIERFGVLALDGGSGVFSGALSGNGNIEVRNSASQVLTGAGTFAGTISVTDARLSFENAAGYVTGEGSTIEVVAGGEIGGGGGVAGRVVIDGGGIVAESGKVLTVAGDLVLGASGVVVLPDGFDAGVLDLIRADSVTAPANFDNWRVEPEVAGVHTVFRTEQGTFRVAVFRAGMIIIVK